MRKLKITEIQRLDAESYRERPMLPITIVLDNIRSMHNVGSIFRTADGFRLEQLVLCGITAQPPHPELHKTALGAEGSVPWQYYSDSLEAVLDLQQRGYKICCLEQAEGSCSLVDFRPQPNERYALVVGNEVHGVRQELIDCADTCLEIPQYGSKHSLNVSVATGIALWQMAHPLFSQLD